MRKMLDEHKNDLRKQFGYNESFAETVAVSVESIIDYFGTEYEDIAWGAVKSCKIVFADSQKKDSKGKKTNIQESIYDVLKRENMCEKYNPIVNAETMKRDRGIYVSKPIVECTDSEYHIQGVERIIVLDKSFNEHNPSSLAVLTNQLMSLIKSYVNEYEIQNGTLIQRTGVQETIYALSNDNGLTNVKFRSSVGEGLEKGINLYDEFKVVRTNYDSNYEVFGSVYQRIIAGFIIDSLEMGEAIKVAELTKDDTALKQLFIEYGVNYEEFVEIIDILAQKDNERVLNSLDSDKLKQSNDELEKYFVTSVVPMVRTLNMSIKAKAGEDYVATEGKKLS